LLNYKVDGGHRAVIFDRFAGIKPEVIGEGTHFMIPWLHKPIIFDIRTRPRSVAVSTGSKGKTRFHNCELEFLKIFHFQFLIK
jgi:regulator of protease activity HflC (stomatin/prohibitin superfamily)